MALEIEPTNFCNLKCIMCHVNFTKIEKKEMIDFLLLKESLKNIKNSIIKIGAVFEPTLHKNFCDIVQFLSNNENKLIIVTNGTNISIKFMETLNELNINRLTVSFDSPIKETYEKIRVNSNYYRVIKNIEQISNKKNKNTLLCINMVLMKSNIDQIIEMIKLCEKLGVDHLGLIFMVIRDEKNKNLFNESLLFIKEYAFKKLEEAAEFLINSKFKISISSPYYSYNNRIKLKYPNNFIGNTVISGNPATKIVRNIINDIQTKNIPSEMKIQCSSPWTFAKILWNGNVDLCYKFKIGNIKENPDIYKIFFSNSANFIREKIIKNPEICYECDYYRYCLSGNKLSYENLENFFSRRVLKKLNIDEIKN